MKITAPEEYGLRCLLQMARQKGVITITQVAQNEALSSAYTAKIMRALRLAGLISSLRGKKGGYQLTLPAREMKIGDILGALKAHLYPEEGCLSICGDKGRCTHLQDCSIRSLWKNLNDFIKNALNQFSLKDLLGKEKEMNVFIAQRLSLH